jgi:hypothetical protein
LSQNTEGPLFYIFTFRYNNDEQIGWKGVLKYSYR